MSFYPAANFILRLCVRSDDRHAFGETERALRWLARREVPVSVSPLALYEVRKHLFSLPPDVKNSGGARLDQYLCEWGSPVAGWSEAIESALVIAGEFRERLAVDSADTLHIGWAKVERCTIFGSFDRASGARALAHAVGLKVWPDMADADFQQFSRLKA